MRHMMIAAALCLAATPLASCATTDTRAHGGTAIDLCARADARRAVYAAAILAADAVAVSGRPVPAVITLGREAALTARAVLDLNCPPAQ